MLVIPAIDIKGGKVVRLYRGAFRRVKVYSDDPVAVAKEWKRQGAKLIHIVDLDGALRGKLKNLRVIKKIVREAKVPAQVGGGVRSFRSAQALFKTGAQRVILGTKACTDAKLIRRLVRAYGSRILVSIDARGGLAAVKGWTVVSKLKAADLAKEIANLGVRTIVYTDIKRDGTLSGPNIGAIKEVLKSARGVSIIASGGIASIKDLKMLKRLEPKGLCGAIVGKAIYEGKLSLEEALRIC